MVKHEILRISLMLASVAALMTSCKKEPIVYSAIEVQTDTANLNISEYSAENAYGIYGYLEKNDVRITYCGTRDYSLLENERDALGENEKAIVVGMSAVKLRNNSISLNGLEFILVDTATNTKYEPKWVKDNDITQFEKQKERNNFCYRLVYITDAATNPENCVLVVLDEDSRHDDEHIFSHVAGYEAVDPGKTDTKNLCPICVQKEYEETTLIVCECPVCATQYVSAHKPPQAICFACSVMQNYCTQCQRYIERGINEPEI